MIWQVVDSMILRAGKDLQADLEIKNIPNGKMALSNENLKCINIFKSFLIIYYVIQNQQIDVNVSIGRNCLFEPGPKTRARINAYNNNIINKLEHREFMYEQDETHKMLYMNYKEIIGKSEPIIDRMADILSNAVYYILNNTGELITVLGSSELEDYVRAAY